jgi:hypothetical protein
MVVDLWSGPAMGDVLVREFQCCKVGLSFFMPLQALWSRNADQDMLITVIEGPGLLRKDCLPLYLAHHFIVAHCCRLTILRNTYLVVVNHHHNYKAY